MNRVYIEKNMYDTCKYEEYIGNDGDNEYGNRTDEYVKQDYKSTETVRCFKILNINSSVKSGTYNSSLNGTYYYVCDERFKTLDRVDGMIVKNVESIPFGLTANDYKNTKDRLRIVTFEG